MVFRVHEEQKIKHLWAIGVVCEVTVGICVKDGSQSIIKSLRSVAAQDFPHERMEVIVVDDGSQDETLSLVCGYAPNMDVECKVYHHSWLGLGYSRSLVAQHAAGKYIVWVDSDITLPKNHISKQYAFMESNPEIGVAKAAYGIISKANLVATLENMSFIAENSRYECGTGGSIYRTQAIREVGYFDAQLKRAGEDHDAAFKIASAGWLLTRSPAVFFEQPRTSWRKLWGKYYHWGFGLQEACKQNPRLVVLYQMLPVAGLYAGLRRSKIAYRLTGKKSSFLLPIQFFYKLSAWCLGYLKGTYSHKKN